MIKDLDLESLSRILRVALNPVVVSLEKRSQETQHVTRRQTGRTWPQAQDSWSPQKLGEQEGPSPGACRGSVVLPTAGFWTSGLRTVRECISGVVSPQSVLLQPPAPGHSSRN